MSRINVYSSSGEEYGDPVLAGWFNPDSAETFEQGKHFDGRNMVGNITGSEWVDEWLFRTSGGRWVLNHDAHRYCSGPDTYEFISDKQAREWLLRSECNDDAVARFFGEIEEERGPGGRPKVGEQVCFTVPVAALAAVDAFAASENTTRSAILRRMVERGVSAYTASAAFAGLAETERAALVAQLAEIAGQS
jgi:hypothetical protein